jgi:DnaJ-domain-containing protein 1
MAAKPNPTPLEAMKGQLRKLLKADEQLFIAATADLLEENCSDLDVENHDEIDDAVHALRFALKPYEPEAEDDLDG